MSKKDVTIIHCSATGADEDIGVNEIDEMHVTFKGFRMVGYHIIIRRDGTVERGRGLHEQGAHARGWNDRAIGVCLIGGLKADGMTWRERCEQKVYGTPEMNFTDEQKRMLPVVIRSIATEYPEAAMNVFGHRELPKVRKACPCFDVSYWRETGEWVE